MAIEMMDYPNPNNSLKLRVAKGHFATSHSHINYYVDLTFTVCPKPRRLPDSWPPSTDRQP